MPGAAVRRRPPNSPTHHPERPSLPPPRYDLAFFGLCVFFFCYFYIHKKYKQNATEKRRKRKRKQRHPQPPSYLVTCRRARCLALAPKPLQSTLT